MIETRDIIVRVPILVPLPSNLTADCDIPPFPDLYQVSDAKELTIELYSALYLCNKGKAEIRDLQPKAPPEIRINE